MGLSLTELALEKHKVLVLCFDMRIGAKLDVQTFITFLTIGVFEECLKLMVFVRARFVDLDLVLLLKTHYMI